MSLLTDVNYPSLGGSQRDFVEYPSQVNENWLLTRPVLEQFAKHYQTGEPMPKALVDKIKKAETFNQGFATVEYLSSALVDMKLHLDPNGVVDADAIREEDAGRDRHAEGNGDAAPAAAVRPSVLVRRLFGRLLFLPLVGDDGRRHLGGVRGTGDPFNRTIADKFRTFLLSTGNETDRAEAYRAFRGRDPDVKALLKRRGFPVKVSVIAKRQPSLVRGEGFLLCEIAYSLDAMVKVLMRMSSWRLAVVADERLGDAFEPGGKRRDRLHRYGRRTRRSGSGRWR